MAVTVVFAFRSRVQGPVPEQPPPLQPAKLDRRPGAAINVTVPLSNVAEHDPLQLLIPAGLDDTLPRPRPVVLTVKVNCCGAKLAVTVVAAFTVTEQLPVPEHPPPLQPLNADPASAAAVSVTTVPLS